MTRSTNSRRQQTTDPQTNQPKSTSMVTGVVKPTSVKQRPTVVEGTITKGVPSGPVGPKKLRKLNWHNREYLEMKPVKNTDDAVVSKLHANYMHIYDEATNEAEMYTRAIMAHSSKIYQGEPSYSRLYTGAQRPLQLNPLDTGNHYMANPYAVNHLQSFPHGDITVVNNVPGPSGLHLHGQSSLTNSMPDPMQAGSALHEYQVPRNPNPFLNFGKSTQSVNRSRTFNSPRTGAGYENYATNSYYPNYDYPRNHQGTSIEAKTNYPILRGLLTGADQSQISRTLPPISHFRKEQLSHSIKALEEMKSNLSRDEPGNSADVQCESDSTDSASESDKEMTQSDISEIFLSRGTPSTPVLLEVSTQTTPINNAVGSQEVTRLPEGAMDYSHIKGCLPNTIMSRLVTSSCHVVSQIGTQTRQQKRKPEKPKRYGMFPEQVIAARLLNLNKEDLPQQLREFLPADWLCSTCEETISKYNTLITIKGGYIHAWVLQIAETISELWKGQSVCPQLMFREPSQAGPAIPQLFYAEKRALSEILLRAVFAEGHQYIGNFLPSSKMLFAQDQVHLSDLGVMFQMHALQDVLCHLPKDTTNSAAVRFQPRKTPFAYLMNQEVFHTKHPAIGRGQPSPDWGQRHVPVQFDLRVSGSFPDDTPCKLYIAGDSARLICAPKYFHFAEDLGMYTICKPDISLQDVVSIITDFHRDHPKVKITHIIVEALDRLAGELMSSKNNVNHCKQYHTANNAPSDLNDHALHEINEIQSTETSSLPELNRDDIIETLLS